MWKAHGQAATETIIMMIFLLLMMFGLIHLCMLMTVKSMVNFSAFAAARSAMVDSSTLNLTAAAKEGVGYMNGWWSGRFTLLNIPAVKGPIDKRIRGKKRTGYSATYSVPFGLPIFNSVAPCGVTNNLQPCGVKLVGFSPWSGKQTADGQPISHDGDNGGS
jgi:TadE-like protein